MNCISVRRSIAVLFIALTSLPAWGQDETRLGEQLTVRKGQKVDNAISIGGNVVVYGEVLKDAVSLGGSLVVKSGGRVGRNAFVIGGRIITEPDGLIGGERIEVRNLPGLSFLGELSVLSTRLPQIQNSMISIFNFLRGIFWFNTTLVALSLGLLLHLFLPSQLQTVTDTIGHYPLKSGWVGAAGLLAFMLLLVMLGISVVGIPMIPILVTATVVALMLGYVAFGFFIGREIPHPLFRRSPGFTIACGVLLLTLANAIPILGGFVFFITILVGYGAVLISRFGTVSKAPQNEGE